MQRAGGVVYVVLPIKSNDRETGQIEAGREGERERDRERLQPSGGRDYLLLQSTPVPFSSTTRGLAKRARRSPPDPPHWR
jgi:hypothetical protein